MLEALMDAIREFQYDYFIDEYVDVSYPPYIRGGFGMHLVDTIVCVVCSQREFSLSKGKSSRVHNGVCSECKPNMGVIKGGESNASSKDGTKGK